MGIIASYEMADDLVCYAWHVVYVLKWPTYGLLISKSVPAALKD